MASKSGSEDEPQALYPALPKSPDIDAFKSRPSESYRKEEDMM